MSILLTVIVTFFAGMGAGLGTGFAGMSGGGHQPDADHILGNGSLHGSGNCIVLGCAGKCRIRIYLWEE